MSTWSWILQICVLLPSLIELVIFIRYLFTHPLEELLLANFKTWLRNYSTCFKIFFPVSLVGYAALGIGWILAFSPLRGLERQKRTTSKNRRLLLMGGLTGYFIIAISSVSFLVVGKVAGSLSEGRGTNLLTVRNVANLKKVFVLLTTSLLCLDHLVKQLANPLNSRPVPNHCIARSDGQASMHTESEGSQNTPPSRKAEPGQSHLGHGDHRDIR